MKLEAGIAAYRAERSGDALVEQYAPLVKRIAHHLLARLPESVLADDLIQAGMVGLLEAARSFDPGKGASFSTFAGIRIRGAMLDDLRRGDWSPRSVHRNARRINEAARELESELGRSARESEVAERLGLDLESYGQILRDVASCRLFSVEELTATDDGDVLTGADSDDPSRRYASGSFQSRLSQAISELPEREQLVLALYYDEELNLKEVGAVLGVSESRVSQILSKTALTLREALVAWQGGS